MDVLSNILQHIPVAQFHFLLCLKFDNYDDICV